MRWTQASDPARETISMKKKFQAVHSGSQPATETRRAIIGQTTMFDPGHEMDAGQRSGQGDDLDEEKIPGRPFRIPARDGNKEGLYQEAEEKEGGVEDEQAPARPQAPGPEKGPFARSRHAAMICAAPEGVNTCGLPGGHMPVCSRPDGRIHVYPV